MEISSILSEIYYNPANPGGFGTAEKLFEQAKLNIPLIKLKDVKEWLKGELTYTLHKPIRKRFKRCKVIVGEPNKQWQADLVDLQEFYKENNGYKYLLTVIDVFSRYAYVVSLKNKTSLSVVNAFKLIFKQNMPDILQTDRGKEFVNHDFKKYLDKKRILLCHSNNQDIKCSLVERFNRTLKDKMFKYFTSKGTRRYIEIIDKFVYAYNNTKHSSIKMKPVQVSFDNKDIVFKNIYGYNNLRDLLKNIKSTALLKIGDKVRIKYNLKNFDRGYYPNWSDHIYCVTKINKSKNRVVYTISDAMNKELKKRFYPEELQKVKENLFRIEKIIKRKVARGKSKVFVKWLNYPDSFNSWIESSEIVKL